MRMAQKRFCRRVALVTSNQANQGTPYLSLIILILPRISLRKESKNRYGVPGFHGDDIQLYNACQNKTLLSRSARCDSIARMLSRNHLINSWADGQTSNPDDKASP